MITWHSRCMLIRRIYIWPNSKSILILSHHKTTSYVLNNKRKNYIDSMRVKGMILRAISYHNIVCMNINMHVIGTYDLYIYFSFNDSMWYVKGNNSFYLVLRSDILVHVCWGGTLCHFLASTTMASASTNPNPYRWLTTPRQSTGEFNNDFYTHFYICYNTLYYIRLLYFDSTGCTIVWSSNLCERIQINPD